MFKSIIQLLLVGATAFSDERKRYYDGKIKALQDKIQEVSDSEFFKKDMEAKGLAERALEQESEHISNEMFQEKFK